MRVGVVGAAGYAGGELLRLLVGHPNVDEIVAGSESLAGRPVSSAHPNLRKRTSLSFVHYEDVSKCDVLFLALPNGAHRAHEFEDRATVLIDLSSDHRLRDPADYDRWYDTPHPRPGVLDRWTYGIPELHRAEIRTAKRITGAGCNATASILALLPLFRAGVVDRNRPVVIECKVGSSEGGREPSEDSHHPERSGVVRSFRPVGHRHTAEIEQELRLGGHGLRVDLSVTSVELVRGVLATAHVYTTAPVDDKVLWKIYRDAYAAEPFVDVVTRPPGVRDVRETNICAINVQTDPRTGKVLAFGAIDNLWKGTSSQALQSLNLMFGFDETEGLL